MVKSVLSSIITNHPLSDHGLISLGEAGNDCENQSHQSCDLCQLHSLQHSHGGVYTHTHTPMLSSFYFRSMINIMFCKSFPHKLKKDPDSPDATPPSTPSSSHSSKPLLQGNGSMDSRTRQRKRKKVSNNPLFLFISASFFAARKVLIFLFCVLDLHSRFWLFNDFLSITF